MPAFEAHRAGRVHACVLGGALGDALGANVEFMPWRTIQATYGAAGITSLQPTYGRIGAVTDDTQMTVFTIEAAIRWHIAQRTSTVDTFADAMWRGYQRWLATQDDAGAGLDASDGWVLSLEWLHHLRGPGMTNLQALRGGTPGSLSQRINDSRGCGGVMRSAPLGLVATSRAEAFSWGLESAMVTHSDEGGFLPAGILSAAIFDICNGADIEGALLAGADIAAGYDNCALTLEALERGLAIGRSGRPTPEQLHTLGGGWQGQDALATAAACVLTDDSLADILSVAANHDGDSDSTASIAGQIVGAARGTDVLPSEWLQQLEGHDDLVKLCDDFMSEFSDAPPEGTPQGEWLRRYPPQ